MRSLSHGRGVIGIAAALLLTSAAWAAPAASDPDCFGPAADAQPGTAAWSQREQDNLWCSQQGQRDAETSPAFQKAAQLMFADPQELALRDDNEWDPDPLRYPPLFWDRKRGHFEHVAFPGAGVPSTDGLDVTRPPGWRNNMIYGQLFQPLEQCVQPPAVTTSTSLRTRSLRRAARPLRRTKTRAGRTVPRSLPPPINAGSCPPGVPLHPPPPYPAVVLQPGTLSNANQMTFLGEILAEHGYVVLITSYFDSSSQNVSTLRAGLDYMLSTPSRPDTDGYVAGANPSGEDIFNPFWYEIDPSRVAVGGHSQGGGSAAQVGFSDPRVKTLLLYDPYLLDAGDDTGLASTTAIKKPTLIFTVDYTAGFSGPYTSQPPPESRNYPLYERIAATGADVMEVALRAATHQDLAQTVAGPGLQDYAQQGRIPNNPDSPTTLPPPRVASGGKAGAPTFAYGRYEQQVVAYYTVAWLDRYLRGISDPAAAASALRRLMATRFDNSIDSSSIGTGTYDPAKAKRAGNVLAGNVPIKIAGWSAPDRLSFYYLSHYQLEGGRLKCADMRQGLLNGACSAAP